MKNESDIVQAARKSVTECDDGTESLRGFKGDLPPMKLSPCHVTPAEVHREHLINGVTISLRHGRRITAGLALVELRRSFAREADWLAFVARHLPIAMDEIRQLIGAVAFRGVYAVCQQCSTSFECPCVCGTPYVPERPWADEPEGGSGAAGPAILSALDRAAEAIKSEPTKSNRLIAKEIGLSEGTVRKARKNVINNTQQNTQVDPSEQKQPDTRK
jgi:hypothetical protein